MSKRLFNAKASPHFFNSLNAATLNKLELETLQYYSKLSHRFALGFCIMMSSLFFTFVAGMPGVQYDDYWEEKGLAFQIIYSALTIIFPLPMYAIANWVMLTSILLPVMFGVLSTSELRLLAKNTTDCILAEEGDAEEKTNTISELFSAQNERFRKSATGLGKFFAYAVMVMVTWFAIVRNCLRVGFGCLGRGKERNTHNHSSYLRHMHNLHVHRGLLYSIQPGCAARPLEGAVHGFARHHAVAEGP